MSDDRSRRVVLTSPHNTFRQKRKSKKVVSVYWSSRPFCPEFTKEATLVERYSAQELECAMCKTRTTPKKRNKGALCNACGKRKRHAEHKDEAAAESLLALLAQ